MPDDQIHLVGAGPKRCCSCKNDRPCNCGCVCEDMTNLDDSGNTPTTTKQSNPSEDCYKAMQFNNYNYSDDPGQPTCQDPYEEPFTGPKAPCWMFVAKDCGDHQKCTKEEALTVCDSPEESIECDGEVIPVLKCYECPCTCETVSKLTGMAEGIYYNSKESCEEARVDDDPGTQDCDKCVEVDFPQGESGSLCDDLRNNYVNCAGNSACIGQQEGTKCWMIVDKTCSDLGSGCEEDPEVRGIKCEPSNSERDCPALQNCWSSCPNGTFVSQEECDQYLEDADDDGACYKCAECNFGDETDCWCLEPKLCSEVDGGLYDGETACDNDLVSQICEGCATCEPSDTCRDETGLDCYSIFPISCSDLGGSYANEADCKAGLVADNSNRCYKCQRITDCDECEVFANRSECWGVFPMSCSELGGMSEAYCDLEVQTRADGPCLKCVDANCPEIEDCFLLQAKGCVEMGCDEFCDDDQDSEPCPDQISGEGECPECLTCLGGCDDYGLYALSDYDDCSFDCDEQEDGCGMCVIVTPAGTKLQCYECQQKSCKDSGYFDDVQDCIDTRFPIDPEHCIKSAGPYCNERCWDCEYKTCADWGRETYDECVEATGDPSACERVQTPDSGGTPCAELDCAVARDCGVCREERPPCECCPSETGGQCGNGCCCCPGGEEPRPSNGICICVPAP